MGLSYDLSIYELEKLNNASPPSKKKKRIIFSCKINSTAHQESVALEHQDG